MYNPTNYKKLSLIVILDQYVTMNAIIDFLATDHTEFKDTLIKSNPKNEVKINNFIAGLQDELEEIQIYLNDEENIDWQCVGINKEFLFKLPRYKRKIEWFRSVDRYPFNHNIFFNGTTEEKY